MAREQTGGSKKTITSVVSTLVLLLLIYGVWWASQSLQTAIVPTGSMKPTLLVDDIIAVRKDAFNGKKPRRGDIVLFVREGQDDYFVKRIVGLPGETVMVASGHVEINGKWLDEPYVNRQMIREIPHRWVLEEDEYFLMGDNRAQSEDSRDFGPVKLENITGLVTGVISPPMRRSRISNPFTP